MISRPRVQGSLRSNPISSQLRYDIHHDQGPSAGVLLFSLSKSRLQCLQSSFARTIWCMEDHPLIWGSVGFVRLPRQCSCRTAIVQVSRDLSLSFVQTFHVGLCSTECNGKVSCVMIDPCLPGFFGPLHSVTLRPCFCDNSDSSTLPKALDSGFGGFPMLEP